MLRYNRNKFWIGLEDEYALLAEKVIIYHLPTVARLVFLHILIPKSSVKIDRILVQTYEFGCQI